MLKQDSEVSCIEEHTGGSVSVPASEPTGVSTREAPTVVPEACRAADAFERCLKTRRVRLRYTWSWGSGQNITLLMGVPLEGSIPAIRVTYARSNS